MKKSLTAGVGALTLVASAATVALVGGAGTASAAGNPSSAFGIEATGFLPIEATPVVESTDGSLVEDSAATFPENPLLTGGIMEVSAQNGAASATVADLQVGDGLLSQLPPEVTEPLGTACDDLTASLPLGDVTGPVNQDLLGNVETILDELSNSTAGTPLDLSALAALELDDLLPTELSGLCDVLSGESGLVNATAIEASCTGDTGAATIADLTAIGLPLEVNTDRPNTAVGIEGVVTATVNRQTQNANGTFTVDALVLELLGQQEIVVASATCGEVTADEPDSPDEPGDAPTPTPVPGDLPVTG
jgi:hypothetical protein